MARATPVGVEIDERVLVAVHLRGECERARCSGQWRGEGRGEGRGREEGKKGRTYDVTELGDGGNVGDHSGDRWVVVDSSSG